jgi:hypothetical protein
MGVGDRFVGSADFWLYPNEKYHALKWDGAAKIYCSETLCSAGDRSEYEKVTRRLRP